VIQTVTFPGGRAVEIIVTEMRDKTFLVTLHPFRLLPSGKAIVTDGDLTDHWVPLELFPMLFEDPKMFLSYLAMAKN
jgi:hypothetical protein